MVNNSMGQTRGMTTKTTIPPSFSNDEKEHITSFNLSVQFNPPKLEMMASKFPLCQRVEMKKRNLLGGNLIVQIQLSDLLPQLIKHSRRSIGGMNKKSLLSECDGIDSCSAIQFKNSSSRLYMFSNRL